MPDHLEIMRIKVPEGTLFTKEESQRCCDPHFKDMVIYFLKGWDWLEPTNDKYRDEMFNSVAPQFYLKDEKTQIDKDYVFQDKVINLFKTSWFEEDKSKEFDLIRRNHKDTSYLVRFLDAYINKPNISTVKQASENIQKLLKFAQMYGFEIEQI